MTRCLDEARADLYDRIVALHQATGWGHKRIASSMGISPNITHQAFRRRGVGGYHVHKDTKAIDLDKTSPRCARCGIILKQADVPWVRDEQGLYHRIDVQAQDGLCPDCVLETRGYHG